MFAPELTDSEIATAWRTLMEEGHAAHTAATAKLNARKSDLYAGSLAIVEAQDEIGRVSDDLIALGKVAELARAAKAVGKSG